MNAAGLDPVEGVDRTRELTLEAAHEVDLLDEIGGAEVRLVEDLVSDRARLQQSFACHRQAQIIQLLLGNKHRSADVVEFVGNFFFFKIKIWISILTD